MNIISLQVGYIMTNCYLVCDEQTKVCAVVDPGEDADRIAAAVEEAGCRPGAVLLTHGHYDHTGGVGALLAAGFCGGIHAHPGCTRERYAREPEGRPPRTVGPPRPLPEFHSAGPVTPLAPGLTLVTDIPRAPGSFQSVEGFSYDRGGQEPDHVPDDAFLALESASGPVIILGCCHSGLGNSLAAARERLGLGRIHAVLGGLHLVKAGQSAVEETAQAVREFGVERLVIGHCTGPKRLPELAMLLPDTQVVPLASGFRIRF